MELCCIGAQCCVSAWHLKQLGLCVSVGICIWIGPMPRMADKWLCVHYHPRPSAPSQRHSQSPRRCPKGCTGVLGPDAESSGGPQCPILLWRQRRSVSCAQRDAVFSWVKALRPLRSALWALWRPLGAVGWGCCQLIYLGWQSWKQPSKF